MDNTYVIQIRIYTKWYNLIGTQCEYRTLDQARYQLQQQRESEQSGTYRLKNVTRGIVYKF